MNYYVLNLHLFCFWVRTVEDVQESISDADGKCLLAKTATNTLTAAAYGLTNNGAKLFSCILVK